VSECLAELNACSVNDLSTEHALSSARHSDTVDRNHVSDRVLASHLPQSVSDDINDNKVFEDTILVAEFNKTVGYVCDIMLCFDCRQ